MFFLELCMVSHMQYLGLFPVTMDWLVVFPRYSGFLLYHWLLTVQPKMVENIDDN